MKQTEILPDLYDNIVSFDTIGLHWYVDNTALLVKRVPCIWCVFNIHVAGAVLEDKVSVRIYPPR